MSAKYSKLALLFVIVYVLSQGSYLTSACSSRTVPKPRPSTSSSSIAATPIAVSSRPPVATTASISTTTTTTTTSTTATTTTTTTTSRPNITFPTYKCPKTYDDWYCLNEATCFSIKIGDSIMYNCECALGFMGQRCEYKELDGSYLPQRPRTMLESASIASGAACALFVLLICLALYLRCEHRIKTLKYDADSDNMSKCPYCNSKRYCDDEIDLIAASTKFGASAAAFRQHIAAISMSFPFRRSAKL